MQIHNVDELKQRVVDVWSGLHLNVVDAAVTVLSASGESVWQCVRAKGGYFEHLL